MSNKTISIIINVDTRPGFMESQTEFTGMFNGTRSLDFFVEGVLNRKQFFHGYDSDVTLFIDHHERLPRYVEEALLHMLNTRIITNLVFNQHTEYFEDRIFFDKWNDVNFLNALMMGRGRYIAHFDGDTVCFRSPSSPAVDNMIKMLETDIEYVSYPSAFSPGADDSSFPEFRYWWASTRFFFCKRETIDYTEIVKCLKDSDYMYGKYGDRRRCPWLENVLGILTYDKGRRVYYPPMSDHYMIFSWAKYISGVLPRLNQMSYPEVVDYVNRCPGRIHYPCDVRAEPL